MDAPGAADTWAKAKRCTGWTLAGASSAWHPEIETVAFLLPDGGASLLLNREKDEKKVKPVWQHQTAEFTLPGESLTAVTFSA